MKILDRSVFFLMTIFFMSHHCSAAENTYYSVQCDNKVGYITGGMHSGTPSLYPLDGLGHILREIHVLALEGPIAPEPNWQKIIVEEMHLPSGISFDSLISPETFSRVTDALRISKTTQEAVIQSLPQFQPYVAYQILARAIPQDGIAPLKGTEQSIVDMGEEIGVHYKTIVLEDPKKLSESIRLLEKSDYEILFQGQLELIKNPHLRDLNRIQMKNTGALLHRGAFEEARLENEKFMIQNFSWTNNLFYKIYYSRNASMAKRFNQLLHGEGPVLAVVGASHLTGDRGILSELIRMGCKIKGEY